jgi:NAD(P)-dependent dehydrogenase (short-subunit alcohol dehydrogenase family)
MPLLAEAAKKGQGRGSVVLTGSVGGIHWAKEVDTLAYQASKAYVSPTSRFDARAVHHLTLTLSAKLIPFGIRVNCIAPGIFPSGMVDMNNTESPLVKAIHTSVPMKRAGKDTVPKFAE